MDKPSILKLSTFKISLLAIPLNLLVALSAVAFAYFGMASLSKHRTDRAIEAEWERISEAIVFGGQDAAADIFLKKIAEERGSARLYALYSPDDIQIVANFTISPDDLPTPSHSVQAAIFRLPEHDSTNARIRSFALADGSIGVLGRDIREQTDFWAVARPSLGIAVAGAVILSIISGLAISRTVLKRLATVNETASRILDGKLDERVPLQGGDDEFGQLAKNLNAMLNRISELMAATREVTDNLAHDLRSPLNRMRGRLELALLPGVSRDELEDAVATSLTDADDLLETFEALLTIARLDHGVAPDFAPVSLRSLAEDVVDYYAPLAEERDLVLKLGELPEVMVMGDGNLLFQAVSNAVDNAIRYCRPEGRITVSIGLNRGIGSFIVADNGPGIPESRREDVLRRFVRLDSSRKEPGTGLGLSLVEAVVRHHHGSLVLEDNKPGLKVKLNLPFFDNGGASRVIR